MISIFLSDFNLKERLLNISTRSLSVIANAEVSIKNPVNLELLEALPCEDYLEIHWLQYKPFSQLFWFVFIQQWMMWYRPDLFID